MTGVSGEKIHRGILVISDFTDNDSAKPTG